MEENKTLAAKEVFDQIVALQAQLADENSNHSLHRMADSLASVFEGDSEMSGEDKAGAVQSITTVYLERENTLRKMLAFYEKIYDDTATAETKAFATKADVI